MQFTSFFIIWVPCIYFSCLISLARTSIISNRSREMDILFLFLIRGKTFSLSPFSMVISCRLLLDVLYHQVRKFSYILSLPRVFIKNRYWILASAFYASIKMIMWFPGFSLLIWWITSIDFWMSNHWLLG